MCFPLLLQLNQQLEEAAIQLEENCNCRRRPFYNKRIPEPGAAQTSRLLGAD